MRVLGLLLAFVSADEAPFLGKDNYDDIVAGRAVLLQFTVSLEECEACGETDERWDALMSEFQQSPEVVVAQVVCDATDGAEALCHDVLDSDPLVTYPSVWYGHPYGLRKYYGDKSQQALRRVAMALRAPCSPWHRDRCRDATMDSYYALSDSDLNQLLVTTKVSHDAALRQIEAQFEQKRLALLDQLDALEVLAGTQVEALLESIATLRTAARYRGIAHLLPPDEEYDETLVDWARDGESYSDADLMFRASNDLYRDVGNVLYDDEYYARPWDENYIDEADLEYYNNPIGFSSAEDGPPYDDAALAAEAEFYAAQAAQEGAVR